MVHVVCLSGRLFLFLLDLFLSLIILLLDLLPALQNSAQVSLPLGLLMSAPPLLTAGAIPALRFLFGLPSRGQAHNKYSTAGSE